MADIRKFKHPDKNPTDDLLARDPVPEYLRPEARLIYLRIIRESDPGTLLKCDRLAVGVTAHMVAAALAQTDGREFVDGIAEAFERLMAPELGQEYIDQVLAKQ